MFDRNAMTLNMVLRSPQQDLSPKTESGGALVVSVLSSCVVVADGVDGKGARK